MQHIWHFQGFTLTHSTLALKLLRFSAVLESGALLSSNLEEAPIYIHLMNE